MTDRIKILTPEQKKNKLLINILFDGLDDDYLKTALLCAYCGEDENILDEMISLQKQNYEKRLNEMKIDNALDTVIPEEEKKNIINKELNSQHIIDVVTNKSD